MTPKYDLYVIFCDIVIFVEAHHMNHVVTSDREEINRLAGRSITGGDIELSLRGYL